MPRPLGLAAILLLALAPLARAEPPHDLGRTLHEAVLRDTLGQFWGAALVAKDGRVLLAEGYGLEGESLRPITADSLFDLASVSKQFTAAAILRLEMQGKLSTADPVSVHLPNAGEAADRITLHHLLTHTSGISDRDALQRLDFADRDEAVRLFFASPAAAPPGAEFEYCNAGYIVLAAVIESVTGRPFQQHLREEIFLPAGMADTAFIDGEGLDPARQTARIVGPWHAPARRGELFQEPWGWGLRGAGGVVSTLNDLVKWDRALAGETLLDAAAKEKLHTPALGGYACGWMVSETDRGTRKATHAGGTRGYRCILTRYPDEGVLIAVITNESGDPGRIEQLLTDVLFPRPRLEAALSIVGLGLDKHGVALLENATRWNVAADPDGRIALTLEHTDARTTPARIVLPPTAARGLAAQLAAVAARADARGRGAMTVMLGTAPYTPDADGAIHLPDDLDWMVMPGYVGVHQDGTRITDPRPTLVLADAERGFWPLIVRMDPALAADLAAQLNAAAE